MPVAESAYQVFQAPNLRDVAVCADMPIHKDDKSAGAPLKQS
jgi:hypothetical protein